MSAITDELNKRTNKLATNRAEDPSQDAALREQYMNQITALQGERAKNLAVEKQEATNQGQLMNALGTAGAMAAMNEGGGGQQVSPQTAAILGKYGVSAPQVQRSQRREVQVKPPNITINNNYNNVTTNNSVPVPANAGGPIQGRPIQFKAADNTEGKSQARFKTWLENMFSHQKAANDKRIREYDRKEWSLSKSINKMLQKMEATTTRLAKASDPRMIGTTIGSQIRTLLLIFGVQFLAKNWDKVINLGNQIYDRITDFLGFFGLGRKASQLRAAGKDLRGSLIWFLTGDMSKAKNPKTSLAGEFKNLFINFGDYIRLWFEKQMAIRGEAIKSIPFPSMGDIGNNIANQDYGLLGNQLKGVLTGFSNIISSTFSNISSYLGTVLTTLVDPVKGASIAAKQNIEKSTLANKNINQIKEGIGRRGNSEFESLGVGTNTSRGDYVLETKNDKGRYAYALHSTALDGSGQLTGSVASTVAQGRDIMGAYVDAEEYGHVDAGRVLAGLSRLKKAAKKNGSVYVDREFIIRFFKNPADRTRLLAHPVKMKYVREEYTADQQLLQYSNNHNVDGSEKLPMGLNGESWGDQVGRVVGDVAGAAVGGGIFLATGGTANFSALGAGYATRQVVKSGLTSLVDWAETEDYRLTLVPATDPRPAANIRGQGTGTYNYYKLSENDLKILERTLYKQEDEDDVALVLSGIENNIVKESGGQTGVRRAWKNKGSKSQWFKSQFADYSKYTDKITDIISQRKAYEQQQENHPFVQQIEGMKERSGYVFDKAGDLIGEGIRSTANLLGITKSTKITKAQERSNVIFAMDYLTKKGLTKEQAAGIVGNLRAESAVNPGRVVKDSNGLYSGGIAMWNGSNLRSLNQYASKKGKKWSDLGTQLDFLLGTLDGSVPYTGTDTRDVQRRLSSAKTPQEASEAWAYYERYAGYDGTTRTARQAGWSQRRVNQEHESRIKLANGAYETYNQAAGEEGTIDTAISSGGYTGQEVDSIPEQVSNAPQEASGETSERVGGGHREECVETGLGEVASDVADFIAGEPATIGDTRVPQEKVKESQIKYEAGEIWNKAYENKIALHRSDGTAFKNFDDFNDWYTNKAGSYSREHIKKKLNDVFVSRDITHNISDELLDNLLSPENRVYRSKTDTSTTTLGTSFRQDYKYRDHKAERQNFRKYYQELDPKAQKYLRDYVDYNTSNVDERFNEWLGSMSDEELRQFFPEISSSSGKVREAVANSDLVKGLYKKVLAGNDYNFAKKGVTKADFESSIYNQEEMAKNLEEIRKVEAEMKAQETPKERKDELYFQWKLLKNQRARMGERQVSLSSGKSAEDKGRLIGVNKGYNEKIGKLSDIEYKRSHFDEYFDSLESNEGLTDQELALKYVKMRDAVEDEYTNIIEELKSFGDLNEKEVKELENAVKEARVRKEKAEKLKNTKTEDLDAELTKCIESAGSFCGGMAEMIKKYGNGVVKALNYSWNDITETYLETRDVLYSKLSALEKLAAIENDFRNGKFKDNPEEYNRLLREVFASEEWKNTSSSKKKSAVSYIKSKNLSSDLKGEIREVAKEGWEDNLVVKSENVVDKKSGKLKSIFNTSKKSYSETAKETPLVSLSGSSGWGSSGTTVTKAVGGRIKGNPNHSQHATVHGGEYVIPNWMSDEPLSSVLEGFRTDTLNNMKMNDKSGKTEQILANLISVVQNVQQTIVAVGVQNNKDMAALGTITGSGNDRIISAVKSSAPIPTPQQVQPKSMYKGG